MIVFRVLNEDIKSFMSELYKGEAFKNMPVRTFEVNTYIKYKIDGYLDRDYFDETKSNEFTTWGELVPFALSALKLKNLKPKSIKLEFCLSDDVVQIDDNVKHYLLHMNYERDEVVFTTNVVTKEFSLNKNNKDQWNDYVLKFFTDNKIPVVKDDI